MALSYWIRIAQHLNRPETDDLGEKVQESVCPCRFPTQFEFIHVRRFNRLKPRVNTGQALPIQLIRDTGLYTKAMADSGMDPAMTQPR